MKNIPDTLIYATNIDEMSGGAYYLTVKTDSISITFNLHNATHQIAEKIIALLNSHLPNKERPLTLWKDEYDLNKSS